MLINNNIEDKQIYFLSFVNSQRISMTIPLEDNEFICGSLESSNLTLKGDDIDECHFKLIKNSTGYSLENTSSHPIFIGDKEVTTITVLKKDIEIKVSDFIITYHEMTEQEDAALTNDEDEDEEKTRFMQVFSMDDIPDKGKLVGVSGSFAEKIIDFTKDKISVGKDDSNDICIKADGLSRAHAMIEINEKDITIIDFNSTNGSFINGKKISTDIAKPGSLIQFANAVFRYELTSMHPEGLEKEKKGIGSGLISIILILTVLVAGFFYYSKKQEKEFDQQKKQIAKLVEKVTNEKKPSLTEDLKIAVEALDNKQYEEALSIIESVLDKSPGNAKALLLQGKINKAKNRYDVQNRYELGKKYYQANEFEKSITYFSQIDADFEKYDEVRDILKKLNNIDIIDEALIQARSDFKDGSIDKTIESIEYILQQIPVHKEAKQLKTIVMKVKTLFDFISNRNEESKVDKIKKSLTEITFLISDKDNFFYKFASKKLASLSLGMDIKVETFYAEGIELFARGNYCQAKIMFRKASILDKNLLKVKLSLAEVDQKCVKLLGTYYTIASKMMTQDGVKAKTFWKKIVESGKKYNSYYDEAIKNLAE